MQWTRVFVRETAISAVLTSVIAYVAKRYEKDHFKNAYMKDSFTNEMVIKKIEKNETRVRELAEKMNLKDVEIYYENNLSCRTASCIKVDNRNVMIMSLSFIFSQKSINEQYEGLVSYKKYRDFMVGHELAHMTEGRRPMRLIALSILPIMTGFCQAFKLSNTGFLMVSLVYGGCCTLFFSMACRYYEKRADLLSAELLDDGSEGIEFFKAVQRDNLLYKNQCNRLWRYHIAKNGDNYFDLEHPLLSQRIKYLEEFNAKKQSYKKN